MYSLSVDIPCVCCNACFLLIPQRSCPVVEGCGIVNSGFLPLCLCTFSLCGFLVMKRCRRFTLQRWNLSSIIRFQSLPARLSLTLSLSELCNHLSCMRMTPAEWEMFFFFLLLADISRPKRRCCCSGNKHSHARRGELQRVEVKTGEK